MKTTYIPWGAFLTGCLSFVFAYFSAVLLLAEHRFWGMLMLAIGIFVAAAAVYLSIRTLLRLSTYQYPVFALLGASIGGFLGLSALAIFIVGQIF